MGAGLHGRHGDFLADGPGDYEERQIHPRGPQHPQGFQTPETGELIVGQDQIPIPVAEGIHHGDGSLDSLALEIIARTPEFPQDELGVIRGVFHLQDAQDTAHGTGSYGLGETFRISQYSPRKWTACANSSYSTGLRT
jgi:hypothetical protein